MVLPQKKSNFNIKLSLILIISYILLEFKSKKIKFTLLELKNPYEQSFVRHPVIFVLTSDIERGHHSSVSSHQQNFHHILPFHHLKNFFTKKADNSF